MQSSRHGVIWENALGPRSLLNNPSDVAVTTTNTDILLHSAIDMQSASLWVLLRTRVLPALLSGMNTHELAALGSNGFLSMSEAEAQDFKRDQDSQDTEKQAGADVLLPICV